MKFIGVLKSIITNMLYISALLTFILLIDCIVFPTFDMLFYLGISVLVLCALGVFYNISMATYLLMLVCKQLERSHDEDDY